MTDFLEYAIRGLWNVFKSIDRKKRKVEHPTNERTGKPLSQKTISNYKSEIKRSEKFFKEIANSINKTLEKNKTITTDTLVEMSRFVLERRGEVGETHCKFVLLAFGASLEQECLFEGEV